MLSKNRQIREYLNRPLLDRTGLQIAIGKISQKLPETVIFGGMLRDFALAGPRKFCSDVDLVSYASDEKILEAIGEYQPLRNKFGGFRFTVEKWQFDLWSFNQTWAFQQKIVRGVDLNDLLKTTFFNVDAVVFHLCKRKLISSDAYEHGIRARILEMNLESNPSPQNMARRAIRLATEHELSIGPKLVRYILKMTRDVAWISHDLREDLLKHTLHSPTIPFKLSRQFELPLTINN